MKKILILGAGSYIGTSFQTYIQEHHSGEAVCHALSLRGGSWKKEDWSGYDCVINVTGKAHADIGNLSEEEKREYYEINCELACAAAKKAIADHVGQYIYFSSIIVYGDSSNSRKPVVITKDTKPAPSNFYGDSKWQAELNLGKIFSESAGAVALRPKSAATGSSLRPEPAAGSSPFSKAVQTRLAVVRPPMVYGEGCKGNYKTLEKMAEKLPVFPDYHNYRSMLYIGNLCEFLYLLVREEAEGLFFPQDREYVKTAELVALLGEKKNSPVHLLRPLAPAVSLGKLMPGKIGGMVRKAFGSLVYEKSMSDHMDGLYQKYSLRESVKGALFAESGEAPAAGRSDQACVKGAVSERSGANCLEGRGDGDLSESGE